MVHSCSRSLYTAAPSPEGQTESRGMLKKFFRMTIMHPQLAIRMGWMVFLVSGTLVGSAVLLSLRISREALQDSIASRGNVDATLASGLLYTPMLLEDQWEIDQIVATLRGSDPSVTP